MKLIESMKRVKLNRQKILDLQAKIAVHCANLSVETPLYGADTRATVDGWLQSCADIDARECAAVDRHHADQSRDHGDDHAW